VSTIRINLSDLKDELAALRKNRPSVGFPLIIGAVFLIVILWALSGIVSEWLLHYWFLESLKQQALIFIRINAKATIFATTFVILGTVFFIGWKLLKIRITKIRNEAKNSQEAEAAQDEYEDNEEKQLLNKYFTFGVDKKYVDSTLSLAFLEYWVCAFAGIVILSYVMMSDWENILLYINQVPFEKLDPIFSNDIAFYHFSLPVYTSILDLSLVMLALLALLSYRVYLKTDRLLSKENRILRSKNSPIIFRIISASVLSVIAVRIYLLRYAILNWGNDSYLAGAGLRVNTFIPPISSFLCLLALILAFVCLFDIIKRGTFVQERYINAGLIFFVGVVIALVGVYGIVGIIYDAQYVSPNPKEANSLHIKYSMEGTRSAYKLDRVQEIDYTSGRPLNDSILTSRSLQGARTIDYRVAGMIVSSTQTISSFFEFTELDVDRYMVNGQETQVVNGIRQMRNVPDTWENHFIYTHDSGIVILDSSLKDTKKPVTFLIKDLPAVVDSSLNISTFNGNIYYAEGMDRFVFTNTKKPEFDYMNKSGTVSSVYKGTGGIPIVGMKKYAIAREYGLMNVFFSDYFTNQSRLHFERDINSRVSMLAPFLYFDKDPYYIVVDGKVLAILSGLTYMDDYPYSFDSELGGMNINYARDCVKAVVDCYNGTVDFYIIEEDPIIAAYDKTYPGLFKKGSERPEGVRDHLKYPEDLFEVQTGQWNKIHLDPQNPENIQTFFSSSDEWKFATETFGTNSVQVSMPYNMILEDESTGKTYFALTRTFTPAAQQGGTGKTNMVSWMGVKEDYPDYGEFFEYRFDRNSNVAGPGQLESEISANTLISREISWLSNSASEIIRGNLMVIPVGGGMIGVEPMFTSSLTSEGKGGSIPQLYKIIVAYQNPQTNEIGVAWSERLDDAVRAALINSGDPGTQQKVDEIVKIIISNTDGTSQEIPVYKGSVITIQTDLSAAVSNDTSVAA